MQVSTLGVLSTCSVLCKTLKQIGGSTVLRWHSILARKSVLRKVRNHESIAISTVTYKNNKMCKIAF